MPIGLKMSHLLIVNMIQHVTFLKRKQKIEILEMIVLCFSAYKKKMLLFNLPMTSMHVFTFQYARGRYYGKPSV